MYQNKNSAGSSEAGRVLTKQEVNVYQESRKARLPTIWITRPEKGVQLGYSIDNEVHLKTKAERQQNSEVAASVLNEHDLCRAKIKPLLCDRHVLKYLNDYSRPFKENGKAVPYERDEDIGTVIKDEEDKPMLDDD